MTQSAGRFLAAALAGFLAIGVGALFLLTHDGRPSVDPANLIEALQGHVRSLTENGTPLPPRISLDELQTQGRVSERNTRAFEGMEVFFYPDATEDVPTSVLLSSRRPGDSQWNVVLGDGSIQSLSGERLAEALRVSGQMAAGQP